MGWHPQLTHTNMIDPETVLQTLQAGRGRLVFAPAAVHHARIAAGAHPLARALAQQVKTGAAALLDTPVLRDGSHGAARQALDRLYTLLMAFHLTGEGQFNRRAALELEAVSEWPTCTGEFLITAEIMHALAMGLDGTALDAASQAKISTALIEKHLRPALATLACLPWWHRDTCNWNTVCNGGIIMGALAAADRAPRLAGRLIAQALAGLPTSLATFAPDGGWPEGPGYGMFAMRYLLPTAESLERSLGRDMGLLAYAGVRDAANFRMHMEGPTGLLFNFADCYEAAAPEPCLFGLSQKFNLPAVAVFARRTFAMNRPYLYFGSAARALMWFDDRGTDEDLNAMPLDACFRAADVAAFRTSWLDSHALYAAVKGGDVQVPHGHADLGTFVIDARGQRFVGDLGADHYDLPGFWSGRPNSDLKRWTIYRNATAGHNTLLVNGEGQHYLAAASITAFASDAAGGEATIDLTEAYEHQGLTRAQRTLRLDRGARSVTVTDVLTPTKPVDVTWQIHTQAQVTANGNQATLTLNGERITMTAEWPDGEFSVEEVHLPPPCKPLENTRRVILKERIERTTTLRVVFHTQ